LDNSFSLSLFPSLSLSLSLSLSFSLSLSLSLSLSSPVCHNVVQYQMVGVQRGDYKLKYLITIHQYNSNIMGRLKDNTSVTMSFTPPPRSLYPCFTAKPQIKGKITFLLFIFPSFLCSWRDYYYFFSPLP